MITRRQAITGALSATVAGLLPSGLMRIEPLRSQWNGKQRWGVGVGLCEEGSRELLSLLEKHATGPRLRLVALSMRHVMEREGWI